jgi:hypothetical protein
MTRDALAVSIGAYEHALRLGHRYLGSEHFLLALASADQPAGAVLREHGVTAGRAGEEIARRAWAALFGGLDRDALAAIGIDVSAVRASIGASFGPEALASASQALHRGPRVRRLDPRRVSGAGRGGDFLPHCSGAEQTLHHAHAAAQARCLPSCRRSPCRQCSCARRSSTATGRRADPAPCRTAVKLWRG